MKSFKINEEASEPYRFNAMDGAAESMAARINETIIKAYHKGAEEKENEMLEFAAFYAAYKVSFLVLPHVEGKKEESARSCYEYWERDKMGEE